VRQVLATTAFAFVLFGAVAAFSQLVANSRFLAHSARVLQTLAAEMPPPAPWEMAEVTERTLARAKLYDDEVTASHLLDGMLVNRTKSGRTFDQCDSLLFSSLRYTALSKFGFDDRAKEAWDGIRRAEAKGEWSRHPRCATSTSRDMVLGLLIALSQSPPQADRMLRDLVAVIDRSGGYFSNGPIYVSYMTPGMARLMAQLAPVAQVPRRELPESVRRGYSTYEWTPFVLNKGYEAHLVALTLWLELELAERAPPGGAPRRAQWAVALDRLVRPLSDVDLDAQRLDWTANALVALDPGNLFFRYLRYKTSKAMRPAVALRLLNELLAMPQFPQDRLPGNCDRRADYLWQRASREYRPTNWVCTRVFHGTDFQWMASLLLKDLGSTVATGAEPSIDAGVPLTP
jgi:hypothetical protein